MYKKVYLISILLLTSLLLSSCQSRPWFFPPTPVPRGSWLIQWLERPVCQPPCYVNIVPGETNLNDAFEILENSPGVTDIEFSLPDKDEFFHRGRITWNYKDSPDTGGAETFSNSLTISDIVLSVREELNIDEIINIYGSPSHLWFFDCRAEIGPVRCSIQLVYIEMGLSVDSTYMKISKDNSSLEITKGMKLDGIYFFPPGMDGFCSSISDCNQDNLAEWKGFGVYPVKR